MHISQFYDTVPLMDGVIMAASSVMSVWCPFYTFQGLLVLFVFGIHTGSEYGIDIILTHYSPPRGHFSPVNNVRETFWWLSTLWHGTTFLWMHMQETDDIDNDKSGTDLEETADSISQYFDVKTLRMYMHVAC